LGLYKEAYDAHARRVHQGNVDIETRLALGQHAYSYARAATGTDKKAAGVALTFALEVLDELPAAPSRHVGPQARCAD
jgi:hypothetical protein